MDVKACKVKKTASKSGIKKVNCVFLVFKNVGDYYACWEVQDIFNTKRKANTDLEGYRDRDGYLDDDKYQVRKMCVK